MAMVSTATTGKLINLGDLATPVFAWLPRRSSDQRSWTKISQDLRARKFRGPAVGL